MASITFQIAINYLPLTSSVMFNKGGTMPPALKNDGEGHDIYTAAEHWWKQVPDTYQCHSACHLVGLFLLTSYKRARVHILICSVSQYLGKLGTDNAISFGDITVWVPTEIFLVKIFIDCNNYAIKCTNLKATTQECLLSEQNWIISSRS